MNKTKNNKYQLMPISINVHKYLLVSVISLVIFFGLVQGAEAANHYIRAGAAGSSPCTAGWGDNQACNTLPTNLTRGDTYYIADGSYPSYTFDDSQSGAQYITIKKATASDHGTDTGWQSSYGDGQAVFAAPVVFDSGYYTLDGNGTHTIPSNNTNDYGIKINSNTSSNSSGIVQIGNSGAVSNITIRYAHIYNTTNGSTCGNGTVSIRWNHLHRSSYVKIQNCYLQNSGKDGLQIATSHHILIERTWIERLGKLLADCVDSHGQTVQAAWTSGYIIFRWNVWQSNEGQALIQNGDDGRSYNTFRFYGNIVYNPYNTQETAGLNISGGILDNAGSELPLSYTNYAIYNNTFVNLRASYTTTGTMATNFSMIGTLTNVYSYNNLWYNSASTVWTGTNPTGDGYHAVGGYGTCSGSNNQTGISSSIFSNFTGNDFRLASATTGGLTLSSQGWWNTTPDSFFGRLDDDSDMYGNVRGSDETWDRGAYEYISGPSDDTPPSAITNLSTSNPTSYSITLGWTSPGDDGNTGKASSYDIRYATSNITESNWSLATQVSDEPSPLKADSPQSMTVTGLLPNTTYYFAIKTRDEVPTNWSEISNVHSATTAEAPSGLIEAESGAIADPMQIVSDDQASGGRYIQTPTTDSGTATYTLNIPETGIYKIVARVYAANPGQDSLFFQIDNQAEDTWDFNPSANDYGVWREDEVTKRGTGTFDNPQYDPYALQLTQGIHTLTFRGREANAKLDYFRFAQTTTDTAPPAAPTGLLVN